MTKPLTNEHQNPLFMLESILEHTPMVMWRKDKEGRYTWVNDRFCRSVGLKREQIIAFKDAQLFALHPDLAQKYLQGDSLAMQNGSFEDSHEPYYAPGSTERRFIHVIKTAIYDERKEVTGTQGAFLDVTSDRYRALFDQAPIGFHELDSSGRIAHINQHELDLLGYEESELEGRMFTNLVLESDVEMLSALLRPGKQTGHKMPGESNKVPVNLRRKDGTSLPVLLTTRQMSSADDRFSGHLCVVDEIGAGAVIEDSLREPDEEYLNQIFKLSLPVFKIDAALRTVDWNPEYLHREKLVKQDQIRGQTSRDIYGSNFGSRYDKDNRQVIDQQIVLDKVELHQDASTTEKPHVVRVLKFPLINPDQTCTGLQCVFWNYEENDTALQMLRKAYEQSLIERSLKTRDATLKMLSHQLRSPIWQAFERVNRQVERQDTGGHLLRGDASPELRQLAIVRGLNRKARRVAWSVDMLWRLAEYSDVVLRRPTLVSPRHLAKLAREAAFDMQFIHRLPRTSGFRQGNTAVDLNFTIDVTVHPYWANPKRMRVDETLIEQAVGNLMDNAFKYSLTNSVIRIECQIDYSKVRLIVKNQSPPQLVIDQTVLDNCRKKDWRAPSAAAVDADGTGLGLWLVDKIMVAHDGELQIQLTDNDGWNEFALQFPLV